MYCRFFACSNNAASDSFSQTGCLENYNSAELDFESVTCDCPHPPGGVGGWGGGLGMSVEGLTLSAAFADRVAHSQDRARVPEQWGPGHSLLGGFCSSLLPS